MNSATKLDAITVTLHWLVGSVIIGLMAVGFYMSYTETWWLYPWHKSLGMLALSVVLLRVIWRLKNGWPQAAHAYPKLQQRLARAVQWILIIATLAMPLSGVFFSAIGGRGLAIFGLQLMAENIDPHSPDDVMAYSTTWAHLGHTVHVVLGYILATALLLHIGGALKHHVIDKDGTLRRMLGKPF